MHASWYKGLNPKQKAERKQELLGYRNAFDALKELLEQTKRKQPVRDYSPGWAEKQIAVNEYNQALDDLMKLIDIKE